MCFLRDVETHLAYHRNNSIVEGVARIIGNEAVFDGNYEAAASRSDKLARGVRA